MSKNATRRSFLKWSAAVAAPLAGAAPAAAVPADDAAAKLARLEDMESIRSVHASFLRAINAGKQNVARNLFADPAKAQIDPALRRIVLDNSSPVYGEGGPSQTVEGVAAAKAFQDTTLTLSNDRCTAILMGACTVHTEAPIAGDSTILKMARLQGDGVIRTAASRTLETAFVKTEDGAWKIAGVSLA